MVLIGAAGRNAGKTELARRLIAREAAVRSVIGVKVTTVQDRHGPCPRGGAGCGVCSSFDTPYLLTEERARDGAKDTSRLLLAGASRVLWLRVLRERLADGLGALLAETGRAPLLVVESNSLRHVVIPGVFAVVRPQGRATPKPSCLEVAHLADLELTFVGSTFVPDPACIVCDGARWSLAPAPDGAGQRRASP